ncbi:hypothetical protein IG631_09590 [Alternaria alternata]|nr:hypothetical protein IG631_09590 [Alternaria alternata]
MEFSARAEQKPLENARFGANADLSNKEGSGLHSGPLRKLPSEVIGIEVLGAELQRFLHTSFQPFPKVAMTSY